MQRLSTAPTGRDMQQLLGGRGSDSGSVVLPVVVLVRVRVVRDAADDNARELSRNPGRFHLKTDYVTQTLNSPVPLCGALYDSISRGNQPIMYLGAVKLARLPIHDF